jgi:hypothetical protein
MADPNALAFSVPTIASSGAPQVVNPLAAISAGNQAAVGLYDLRAKQASEAAGQAYQGAINPQTGELDANEFRRRLAASGPAAMAAGASLANIQNISSNQLEQSLKKAGWVNAAAGAALQSGDFSDGAMLRLFQSGLANGTLTMPEVQRQMAILPPDAEGRRKWLQEHQDTAASVEEQYKQRFGTRPQVSAGGTTEFPIVPSARSGLPGPSVQQTATPGEQAGLVTIHVPVDAAGNPTTPDKAVRYDQKQVPRGSLPGLPMPAVPGAAPPAQTLPTNAAKPSGTPPGRNTPIQPALVPPPAPNSAAPAPEVPASTPGVVTGTGGVPMITSAPPQGQPERVQEDVKQWQTANADMDNKRRNEAAGVAALQALEYAHTGPGTGNVAAVRNFMITQGIPGYQLLDSTQDEQRQIAKKNLLRFAQSSGARAGTDLGLTTQLESNANVDTMLQTVNTHILKGDLGLARQRIAQQLTAPDGGTGKTEFGIGQGEHIKNFTSQTDPVAFAWDKLDEHERAAHLAEIAKVQGGMEKWKRSMKIARDTGLIQVPTAPPDRRSAIMPQMMPGPLPNALLA